MTSLTRPHPSDRVRTEPDPVAAFVARHQTATWRFLRVLGCRGQQAEAIALDALVLAVGKGMHTAAPGEVAAFLWRTCRHLWLREQRDDRRRAERHAEAVELLWRRDHAADDGAGWLDALDSCLAELPERSRRALEATYRDGLGRAELGAELGIGEHGVRTLLQRLRAALRTCIERRRQP